MFDQLSGPVVLICGQNKVETGSKEKEKFVSFIVYIKLYVYTDTGDYVVLIDLMY